MTEQEEQWLDALTKDRSESADMLEKPSMRGVQRSVVDKYSDQAHFIYELLQNADDVKATSASFRLEKDGLFFIHNGSVRFTVSNPQSEDADTNSGTLGHLNSITSIANSNKTEASIGKFGVGFKAVFQYTQTPHIYDPKIRFKIERFIVPHMLDSDLEGRKSSETAFFFPFDHKTKRPQESYDEILEKLKSLEFPVLFLSNLQSVSFEADDVTGEYTKKATRTLERGDITVQWLILTLKVNGKKTAQRLVRFTRSNASKHPCSIGYALGEDGSLVPIDRPAFCFFPTKETTNLNFILHAPFLLTDSREGIKAGEKHNQELVQQLAQLAAGSLPILRDEKLIDDGILDIIPYDEARFRGLDDRRKISFKPFFSAIKDKLQTDALLPAANGKCSSKSHSYWASDTELVELFSDKQLAHLTGVKDAHWVVRSRGKKEVQNADRELADYIDGGDARAWNRKEPNLIVSSLAPEDVLKRITSDFIAAQSQKWLHDFYGYLSERASYQKFVKDKPIFLDQEGNAVPAFDDNDQLILFLPDDDIDGYTTVKKELLSKKATREFIERFDIKKPSLHDEIYNKILPSYDTDEGIDTTPHFMKFFRYFKACPNEKVAEFIELIEDLEFLEYKAANDEMVYRGKASDIYLPTSDLLEWFEPKLDINFLLLDKYREMVDERDYRRLDAFLSELNVLASPQIIDVPLSEEKRQTMGLHFKGNHGNRYTDKAIDGLDEALANMNHTRSLTVWRVLTSGEHCGPEICGVHEYHLPYDRYNTIEHFESSAKHSLCTEKWILDKAGELVSGDAVTVQTLSDEYDTTSPRADALIRFLGIRDEAQDTAHLSEEEARKIRLADEVEQSGLTEDEIRTAIEDAKRRKSVQPSTDKGGDNNGPTSPGSTLIQEIERRRPSVKNANSSDHQENDSTSPAEPSDSTSPAEPSDANEDADDYTPKAVDYGKKLDRAKDRYASELDRIEREQTLHDKANSLPRYSYGWFLALMELECMASSEKNADSKSISISFGKVERESQSARTIVLKEPSRFIPQSIEEFSGVRVDLDFGNGRTGKLRIESFTAKEFSLFGKLESACELDGIDLGEVLEARIEVQNPSFLLQELLERFRELKLDEKFNMKANLTPQIEFVFGPPGTGKTTHLAENVLIPRMSGTKKARVLVLTPTNKAADVLTTCIMDAMDGNTSYLNWLVRFGTSADEHIEKAGVWRDRSFDIGGLSRSVTVTTIARFAYDGFAGEHGRKLCEMKWDVIVFDEASMISLASIIYPLYRQKPQEFIIAGDPFQIEPIVAVEQWKDENIYTLVGLNKAGSFAKPATEPHNYSVTNLEIQYRSIPAIGDVFSRFTYDGILKHHRDVGTQSPLKLNGFDAKPLNLIKFPVSKYESIYRAKRLESGTPYQTYSALFTFEFVRWLAVQIQDDRVEKFRIGVIAPYRAQANVLSRLNDSWATKPDAVEIQVGTIHGFQGDECDIIIAVLNPPPKISTAPRMFLNKQNILNVAISRARDYLFLVMPDDETEGVENLRKIAKIEKLVKSSGAFSEYASRIVEEMIWGNENYLEENTFSTGHQMVNVYRTPERYYEVRSDESAIDVQVHEKHVAGLD
ncbi:MAG: DEAD/DEAH box helicase [Candidatus Paceibacterota bacterium]